MNAPAELAVGPWEAARVRHGDGVHLLRVIDVTAQTDEFRLLPPMRDFADYDLDGCTLITGIARGLEPEERRQVIAHFDALWQARAREKARR